MDFIIVVLANIHLLVHFKLFIANVYNMGLPLGMTNIWRLHVCNDDIKFL